MKKILVTGSSGYLGSQFINLYKHLYDFKTFSLLKSSINLIKLDNIDCILHCAALVHQTKDLEYKDYYKVNVTYTLDLAKRAKSNGVNHFIFISSISVYDSSVKELNEMTEKQPSTFYGKSKLEAEVLLTELIDDEFKVSIIRSPMIYGKDAPGNILKLRKIVDKFPIIPLGGIENKRSFVFIKNLCFSINHIIIEESKGAFLICDNESISTTRLVTLLVQNSKRKKYIIKLPFFKVILALLKPNIYSKLCSDLVINNKKTLQNLNYKNPYSLEEGIKEV
jgi:UDP-glucose 4-epimerase